MHSLAKRGFEFTKSVLEIGHNSLNSTQNWAWLVALKTTFIRLQLQGRNYFKNLSTTSSYLSIGRIAGRIVGAFWKKKSVFCLCPESGQESGRIVMWHKWPPTLTACFLPFLYCFGPKISSFCILLSRASWEKTRKLFILQLQFPLKSWDFTVGFSNHSIQLLAKEV